MKQNIALKVGIVIIFLSMLWGCSQYNNQPQTIKTPPDIRGEIKQIIPFKNGDTMIHVISTSSLTKQYTDVEITISSKTKIFVREDNGYRSGSVTDLAVGQTVEALFIGLVQESLPAHANASEVIIDNNPTE